MLKTGDKLTRKDGLLGTATVQQCQGDLVTIGFDDAEKGVLNSGGQWSEEAILHYWQPATVQGVMRQ